MSPAHPDAELAGRAARGDGAAWREIYTATRDRLFALLSWQLGNREEALDLLQETYLAAVRGIAAYRAEGSLESWLVGIALRRARDWKRRFLPRIKRTSNLEEIHTAEQGLPQPDPEMGRRLRQALNRLTHHRRSAVVLHEWMGYSFREVAEALGVSEATARVHCFRGREDLRALLSDPAAEPVRAHIQEQQS